VQATTGTTGYRRKDGSVSASVQRKKIDPFDEFTIATWPHVAHKPPRADSSTFGPPDVGMDQK
jgi:hypothetical protein